MLTKEMIIPQSTIASSILSGDLDSMNHLLPFSSWLDLSEPPELPLSSIIPSATPTVTTSTVMKKIDNPTEDTKSTINQHNSSNNQLPLPSSFGPKPSHSGGLVTDAQGRILYQGELKNGLYHGVGTQYVSTGAMLYQGSFLQGLYHGRGTLYYPSGRVRFVGSFQKGKQCGEGEVYFDQSPSILQFKGYFVRGKREGFGKQFSSSGEVEYAGVYYHDKPSLLPVILNWGLSLDIPQVLTSKTRSFSSLLKHDTVVVSLGGDGIKELVDLVQKTRKNMTNCSSSIKTDSLSIVSRYS